MAMGCWSAQRVVHTAQEAAARRKEQRVKAEADEARLGPLRLYLYGFLSSALLAAVCAGAPVPAVPLKPSCCRVMRLLPPRCWLPCLPQHRC